MAYEEQVKRLRNKAGGLEYDGWVDTAAYLEEAADAIEELTATAESYKRSMEAWADEAARAQEMMPRWIPVTERLPEERINPNTQDFEYVLCTTIWGDVRPFKYGTPIGSKDAHFWNGAGYVDAYVTHWMPLPEPQEVEA